LLLVADSRLAVSIIGIREQSSSRSKQQMSDLLDRRAACAFFGGTKPINIATLYRNIRAGRFPRPVKIGPGTSRWLRSECEIALAKMMEARNV
jgi:predicted DNA-binding transcriptional regulator AlpA